MTFCKKSGMGGRPTIPDFLAFQIQISRFPDFLPSYSSTIDADSQARGGRGGRSEGVSNHRNNILIEVVELYLPQGLEAWRAVALLRIRESLWRQFFVGGRIFGTTGTGSSATAHRSRQVCPVSIPTVYSGALRLSVAFSMKPLGHFGCGVSGVRSLL